jgi:hypothetical protein
MIICKFTHDSSLLCDGMRFWLLGQSAGTHNWFDLHDAVEGDIVAATNLDEGRCHIVTNYGAVFEVRSDPSTGFVIQKIKAP